MTKGRLALGVVLIACAAACETPDRRDDPTRVGFQRIRYELAEQSRERSIAIPPGVRTSVDTRSDLVLQFERTALPVPPADGAADEIRWLGGDWARVQIVLEEVTSLAQDVGAINQTRVDPTDADAVAEIVRRSRAADERVVGLLDALAEAGLDDDEQIAVFSGTFDGPEDNAQPYVNVARWLAREIERLKAAVEAEQKEKSAVVNLRVIHVPVDGEPARIDVPGWDPVEVFDAPPGGRTPFLTPGEQRRLRAELAAARSFKEALGELGRAERGIEQGAAAIEQSFQSKLGELEALGRRVAEQLEAALGLTRAPEPSGDEDEPSDAVLAAAADLAADLAAYRDDLSAAQGLLADAARLRERVAGIDASEILSVVDGSSPLVAELQRWIADAGATLQVLATWKQRIPDTMERLQTLARAAGETAGAGVVAAAQRGLQDALEGLSETLPATVGLAKRLLAVLEGRSSQIAKGAAALSAIEPTPDVPVDELREARIDLSNTASGDDLLVRLRFESQEQDEGGKRELLQQTDYKLEVDHYGLYRDVAGVLIFARGDRTGTNAATATDWKPNVAATLNWHYRYRDPETAGQAFWNGWNPGIGFHLASLDQGDDTVEVGIGPCFSLWDDYLYGGLGWNLGVGDDRLYYFFGTNLFSVLNAAREQL